MQRLRRDLCRDLPCNLASDLILFRDCEIEHVRVEARDVKLLVALGPVMI